MTVYALYVRTDLTVYTLRTRTDFSFTLYALCTHCSDSEHSVYAHYLGSVLYIAFCVRTVHAFYVNWQLTQLYTEAIYKHVSTTHLCTGA